MQISTEFVGPVRRPTEERLAQIEVSEGATLEKLLADLEFSEADLKYLTILLNGKKANFQTVLQPSDKVTVMLLVGGG